jgi:hypothetical protein
LDFFVWAMWKTRHIDRGWICWINSVHGSCSNCRCYKGHTTTCLAQARL